MSSYVIAVVQFEPKFGRIEENRETITRLIDPVDADLIVLPELCTTGYFFLSRQEVAAVAEQADGPIRDFFQEISARKNATVVAGFPEKDGSRIYNACMVEMPGQTPPRVYRKTHLFYRERFCFDPGDTGFFVVTDPHRDVRIGPMICYDWRFPESARVLALQGADIIVCPANLVTTAWQQVMPARAIENHVYLAVANRIGLEQRGEESLSFRGESRIYDCDGRPIASADGANEAVILAMIDPSIAREKSFNPFNDVFQDRAPAHYARITKNQ